MPPSGDCFIYDTSVCSDYQRGQARALWPDEKQNIQELERRIMGEPREWLLTRCKPKGYAGVSSSTGTSLEPFYQIWRRGATHGYFYARGLHADMLYVLWQEAKRAP